MAKTPTTSEPRARARGPQHHRRAFTLAEAAVSMMVVGLMLVVALNLVATSARARQVNARLGVAPALAHDLMSEVLQAWYTEPDGPPDVESAEVQFDSSMVTGAGLSDTNVKDYKWYGQHFKPTLPADALSWKVTRVQVYARQNGAEFHTTTVELRRPDESSLPGGAVVDTATVDEADLPVDYTWWAIPFSSAGGLSPDEGLCLVVRANSIDPSMKTYCMWGPLTNLPGAGLLESYDAGASWTLNTTAAFRFMVYGTVTTPGSVPAAMGPDTGEASSPRADFDDVDDYDGWSASPPQRKDGTKLTEYADWSRAVSVEYVVPTAADGAAVGSDQGVKRIKVVVTDPRGAQTTLYGLRSNVGVYEQEVAATKTYVSWVGLDLQIGGANAPLALGTSLANEPVAK